MDDPIVDKVLDEVVKNVSFKNKIWESIKKLVVILTLIMIIYKGGKWWINNTRLSWKLQLGDDTWGTVIWIKVWYLTFGIIIVVLENKYDLIDKFIEFIKTLIDVFT